ncbi:NAD-dependent epimerase/dehydratase family protein [Rickettsiales endosymbiont of Peranema trichophorum]|nr:NAD-dependent epimerase/dehydratase family protein [Rickettsiales endosymbiont of Peranema trichophorum]
MSSIYSVLSKASSHTLSATLQENKEEVLITGCAGFIGLYVAQYLLAQGFKVVGIDNISDYYSRNLKKARLTILKQFKDFEFYELDICHFERLKKIASKYTFKAIIHLAAQPGVRYSVINPFEYVRVNINGFLNILEIARHTKDLDRLVYASSSSVYGNNKNLPFSTNDKTDSPISLYAATKKSDELMAYAYSHLYNINIIGLRFFTVYGPWGRPDMAIFKFTDSIFNRRAIEIYNYGNMKRDFTYISDVLHGILGALQVSFHGHRVYNLGNSDPVNVLDVVKILETAIGMPADFKYLPIQQGDAEETFADIQDSTRDLGFRPNTPLHVGIKTFVEWYREYHSLKK